MNSTSSRGHTIFKIRVISQEPETTKKVGEITLIDLAGSERAKRTGNNAHGAKEGANINSSLSVLGRCFQSVSSGAFPPFRDSKLTYIISPYFIANCSISVLTNINTR